jgi:uncharacterized surface protein with fasciclin (FAS1) repeats
MNPNAESGFSRRLLPKRVMHRRVPLAAVLALATLACIPAQAGSYVDDYGKDIVDVAASAGTFKTLAAALEAAGLVETLRGDGPFTMFAPTDEAFAKLPQGAVERLLRPENRDQLAAILTYHVVAGEVTSHQVVRLNAATTVNGQDVRIQVRNGNVMIDDAILADVDFMASNGIIHVIDQVILPN